MTKKENTAKALHEILFDTVRALSDKQQTPDIERARAISVLARDIISLARLELDASETQECGPSNFLAGEIELPNGITGITRHKLK